MLGGETARVLEVQARKAVVISDVQGRMIDLEVSADSPSCDCADGPLAVCTSILRQGGQLVDELPVWVRG